MIKDDLLKIFDQNAKSYEPNDIIHRIEVIKKLFQNALVVVEMLFLSLAGPKAYSHVGFMQAEVKQKGTILNVI